MYVICYLLDDHMTKLLWILGQRGEDGGKVEVLRIYGPSQHNSHGTENEERRGEDGVGTRGTETEAVISVVQSDPPPP